MRGLGYKEFKTERKYMAQMGDWRNYKDEEIELDGERRGLVGENLLDHHLDHLCHDRQVDTGLSPKVIGFGSSLLFDDHQLRTSC